LDSARHLAIKGRYPSFIALPDRWVSWWLGGVITGIFSLIKYRPKVIWSTYPIATAHLIALTLSKVFRLPWIADFRDSMTEENYPTRPSQKRIYEWIEKRTIQNCKYAVFTTQGAVEMYSKRYPDQPDDKWQLIPNGYNEDIFGDIKLKQTNKKSSNDKITIVHSGVIYPSERDPNDFFAALSELKATDEITSSSLNIVLRATGHDDHLRPLLDKYNISDIVELAPSMNYRAALEEMCNAEGLLILQAANCNHQVPAKVYEYFRTGRPILALTDPQGNTAKVVAGSGVDYIAPLDNTLEIKTTLRRFLTDIQQGNAKTASKQAIEGSSREAGTKKLADLLSRSIGFI
jgi:hypothetical protein